MKVTDAWKSQLCAVPPGTLSLCSSRYRTTAPSEKSSTLYTCDLSNQPVPRSPAGKPYSCRQPIRLILTFTTTNSNNTTQNAHPLLPVLREPAHPVAHGHGRQPARVPDVPVPARHRHAHLLAQELPAQGEGGRLWRAGGLGQRAKGPRAVPRARLQRRRGRLLPGPDPQRRRADDDVLQVHDVRESVERELRRKGCLGLGGCIIQGIARRYGFGYLCLFLPIIYGTCSTSNVLLSRRLGPWSSFPHAADQSVSSLDCPYRAKCSRRAAAASLG